MNARGSPGSFAVRVGLVPVDDVMALHISSFFTLRRSQQWSWHALFGYKITVGSDCPHIYIHIWSFLEFQVL